ncbi:MAG: hypothetical protein WC712_05630 [Candidatus Brocadiia bacterium]
MRIVGRKVAIVMAVLAIALFVFGAQQGYATNDEQIRNDFRKAINAFEEGNYKEAKVLFAAVLNGNPSNKLAAELRNQATLKYLMEVAKFSDIGPDVWRLLALAGAYDRQEMRKPEAIQALIGQMDRDFEERRVAMAKLVDIGNYVIPFLVPHLADPNSEDGMRTYAYLTIMKMGHSAIQPLVELLNTNDELLLQNVCNLLAVTNDPRALPYLLAVAKNGKTIEISRSTAGTAFTKISGVPLDKADPIENYFFNEALRYYQDLPVIQEEAYASEGMIWRWDATAKNIVASNFPIFSYNEEIARGLCYRGMDLAPKSTIFIPLIVCLGYSEYNEVKQRRDMLAIQAEQTGISEETKAAIIAEVNSLNELYPKVERANAIGHLVGQKALSAALDLALANKKDDEAVSIINALADVSDGTLLPPPAVGAYDRSPSACLIDALSSNMARVRYEAAISLAKIDPKNKFQGQEKVAAILAAAMSETSSLNFLVCDNETAKMNFLVELLRKNNYGADGAFSGRACLAKASVYPMKDIILLDYTLDESGDLNVDQVYRRLQEEPLTASMPIIFMVPAEMMVEFKTKFPGDNYVIAKPPVEGDLLAMIGKIVSERNMNNPIRAGINSIAVRAAEAISKINPATTNIDLKVAVPMLIAVLNSHVDAVRVGAMKTLANVKAVESLNALKDVFKNKDNSTMVRVTSLQAIGMIDPAAAQDLLEEAIADADYLIALEASKALGRGNLSDEAVLELLKKSLKK